MTEEGQLGGVIDGSCPICHNHPSKYRCPGCDRQCCSLGCVREHKSRFACSGKRPITSTKYLPVSLLTPEVLLDDFRLLENAAASTETLARITPPSGKRPRLSHVTRECKERRIELCLMPLGMARAKLNKTHLVGNQIFWTVEWILLREKLPDHPTLLKMNHLKELTVQTLYSTCPETATIQESFTALRSAHDLPLPDLQEAEFLLRQEVDKDATLPSVDITPSRRLWALHSVNLSWSRVLAHRTIIEFPTVYIHPHSRNEAPSHS